MPASILPAIDFNPCDVLFSARYTNSAITPADTAATSSGVNPEKVNRPFEEIKPPR